MVEGYLAQATALVLVVLEIPALVEGVRLGLVLMRMQLVLRHKEQTGVTVFWSLPE